MLRLQLNPTKTQVMWLGCGQQLKHVDTAAEPDQDPRYVPRLPTKTKVTWLGSGQQLKHVDTTAEPDQDPGHVARLKPATEAC